MKIFYTIYRIVLEMERLVGEDNLKEFMNTKFKDLYKEYVGLKIWVYKKLMCDNKKLYYEFIDIGISDISVMEDLVVSLFYIYVDLKYKKFKSTPTIY